MTDAANPDDDDVEPWWGPMDPDVMIVIDRQGRGPVEDTWPPTSILDEFALELRRELQDLENKPTLLVAADDIPVDADMPGTIFAVVTNDAKLAAWGKSWGGNVVSARDDDESLVLEGRATQVFAREQLGAAVRFASNEIDALPEDPPSFGITVVEHRQLEVVLHSAVVAVDEVRLAEEDRALLQAAVDTLRAQLASPEPDRHIIGRVLRRVAIVGGVLIGGVAGNYLTDLLRHFHVPWP